MLFVEFRVYDRKLWRHWWDVTSRFSLFVNAWLFGWRSSMVKSIKDYSFCGTWENSADSDQTPHNVASDQALYPSLTECSIKYWIKHQNTTLQPKTEMDWSNGQEGNSFRLKWVKGVTYNKHMSQCMRFPSMWYMRTGMPHISLRIRAVWSELC